MKVEETMSTAFEGRTVINPLDSRTFLDEFALAYHRTVVERLRAVPEDVLERARRNLNWWTKSDAVGAGELASLKNG